MKKYLLLSLIFAAGTFSLLAQNSDGLINGEKMYRGISVDDFLKQYTSNPAEFLTKYKGHEVMMHGNVSLIEKGSSDNIEMVVTLNEPGNSSMAVKAQFPIGLVNEGNDLIISNDGQSVTIVRRMQGNLVRARKGRIMGEKPLVNVGQITAIQGMCNEVRPGAIILTGCRFAGSRERVSQHK